MIRTAITTDLDPETASLVDRVAASRGQSRESFAAEAIRRVAEHEADYLNFVQEGIDAADRGELIPGDVVMAELEARIEAHRLRWQKS